MTIHIINLSQNITADSLEILFGTYGQVVSASLIPQRDSVSRYALIKMSSESEAQAAVARLNGCVIDGRMVSARIMAGN
jgi:RNA recognition motif-containing protein